MLFYQKILDRWKKEIRFEEKVVTSVEEGTASLTVLLLHHFLKEKIVLEVPGYAYAEKLRGEMELWKTVFQLSPEIAVLPDGFSCGKKLAESESPRAQILDRVLSDPPEILIVSAAAELSGAPPPEKMKRSELLLKKGMEFAPEKLAKLLVELDYDDEPEVIQSCEFARRGGILDVFSPAADFPARIDFFGDEIDSIRSFSAETQLSTGEIDSYRIILRSGSSGKEENEESADFTDYIRFYQPQIVTLFPEECLNQLHRFLENETANRWEGLHKKDSLWLDAYQLLDAVESTKADPVLSCTSDLYPSARHILQMLPEGAEENMSDLIRQLSSSLIRQLLDEKYHVVITGTGEHSLQNMKSFIEEENLPEGKQLERAELNLPCGFIVPSRHLAFFSEYELYCSVRRLQNRKIAAPVIPAKQNVADLVKGAVEESMSADLEEGDPAVHINYGICIYHGLRTVEDSSGTYEAIVLEFDNDAYMNVPISQAHCVSRYIGAQKGSIKLSKIGSSRWNKVREAAAMSVRNLALDMLKIHAVRCQDNGVAFPADDLAQEMFEKAFPFAETRDQLRAAEEIKHDMESSRPMDRLLCGDVGYGKTEVAMRAVFKCVMAGKQAAILVPTTVLAQQHFYSFQERFAEYPVVIDTLSRLRTSAEQQKVLERLRAGTVDIVIGTHRLIQNDVKFKDLGLLVIDEEQRFGVLHKERLKNLRTMVDVLTMTATPIPRTLYFSMSGMRDLSTIMTAPVQRLPVQTVVSQFDSNVIRAAVTRELQRGGQVYYLHNRVQSIESTAKQLQELLPEARIGIGHGQMEEHRLEEVMKQFIEGKLDILVCTTIIESGLDIPNANTIIIERADQFGLAELYQLRGRVGRWKNQAYAYLLLPKHGILTGDVRKRIAAIRKYTHLGAGFKLALRDLEIRGAGNILGAEQSGHINAIGFTLYCQLLKEITGKLKGENTTLKRECNVYLDFVVYALTSKDSRAPASFPEEYIPSERLRLDAYRRLAMTESEEALEVFRKELKDRFGKLPPSAENLFLCAGIRIAGMAAKLNSITCSDGRVLLERNQQLVRIDGKIPSLSQSLSSESKLRILKGMLEKFFLKKNS